MQLTKYIFNSLLLTSLSSISYADNINELLEMDLEQLMDIEVISIAKKPQSIRKTAAAIHVILQRDIQRSGATSLPEVLRGAPGVYVAHVNANKWAVSIRGFSGQFSNKLLVMIDGRSIYSPLFSGVFWNMYDIPLSTIQRIEIVRGPGGTLWGENAVNGVINIITKQAKDTQGTQLSFLGGSNQLTAHARYGGSTPEIDYRVNIKAKKQYSYQTPPNQPKNHDDWEDIQAQFRIDGKTPWSIQGGYSMGDPHSTVKTFSQIIDKDNNNYQSTFLKWNSKYSFIEDNDFQLQAYYDYEKVNLSNSIYSIHTIDLDTQHQFNWHDNHHFIWGLGYRGMQDSITSNFFIHYAKKHRFNSVFTGFIQDEVHLSDSVQLTLGTKFSHNTYSGFEYQPSLRLLWEVSPQHSIWGAISRAVRTPARLESDISITIDTVTVPQLGELPLVISGSPDFKSEALLAFELGYRGNINASLSFDSTIFYHDYSELRSLNIQGFDPKTFSVNGIISNHIMAKNYGLELFMQWKILDNWQLSTSYSLLKTHFQLADPYIISESARNYEIADPRHQLTLQSLWQLPFNLELNSTAHYKDRVNANISSYIRLDLGLTWQATPYIGMSIVGQNLMQSQHNEFFIPQEQIFNSEVPRSVYAKIKVKF